MSKFCALPTADASIVFKRDSKRGVLWRHLLSVAGETVRYMVSWIENAGLPLPVRKAKSDAFFEMKEAP